MSRSGGIRWRGDSIAAFREQLVREFEEDLEAKLPEMLNGIGTRAAQRIRRRHLDSGTRTRPSGRVETGQMYHKVGFEAGTRHDKYYVRFGWPQGATPYTKMQDQGTLDRRGKRTDSMNPSGNSGIPAMFALFDAFERAKIELEDFK